MYPDLNLLIVGKWVAAEDGAVLPVVNPATGDRIGTVTRAGRNDLARAVAAAQAGFEAWRAISPFEPSKVMREAAGLLRDRADFIAEAMSTKQGKTLAEARGETLLA